MEVQKKAADDEIRIKNELEEKVKILNKKLEELKLHEERCRREEEEHKQKKKIAKIKMTEAARIIANYQDQVKIDETSIYCLDGAVLALNEVEGVMMTTANFWRETASVCELVTRASFTKQVMNMMGKAVGTRNAMWKSTPFKKQALQYYGIWVALKNIYDTAGEYIHFAKDKMQKYLRENPNDEESQRLVREIADQLKQDINQESIEDEQ